MDSRVPREGRAAASHASFLLSHPAPAAGDRFSSSPVSKGPVLGLGRRLLPPARGQSAGLLVRWTGNRCGRTWCLCSSAVASALRSQVLPEAGPRERGPGRQPAAALGALQLLPSAGGPVGQVRRRAPRARWRVALSARGFASNKMKNTGAQTTSPVWCGPDFGPSQRNSHHSHRQVWTSRAAGSAPWAPSTHRPAGEQLCRWSLAMASEHCLPSTHLCPQVLPHGREAADAPGQPAGSSQPSDHSYALLDLDALKRKLFLTLKENEKLRKRLKAQRLMMQRMCGRLRAHRVGSRGLQARARPEQR